MATEQQKLPAKKAAKPDATNPTRDLAVRKGESTRGRSSSPVVEIVSHDPTIPELIEPGAFTRAVELLAERGLGGFAVWLGHLHIGVTRSDPDNLNTRGIPDKIAQEVPPSKRTTVQALVGAGGRLRANLYDAPDLMIYESPAADPITQKPMRTRILYVDAQRRGQERNISSYVGNSLLDIDGRNRRQVAHAVRVCDLADFMNVAPQFPRSRETLGAIYEEILNFQAAATQDSKDSRQIAAALRRAQRLIDSLPDREVRVEVTAAYIPIVQSYLQRFDHPTRQALEGFYRMPPETGGKADKPKGVLQKIAGHIFG